MERPLKYDMPIKALHTIVLKKITKSNIKAFLAEKNISLSRNSEDILYQQVNFKIKLE